MILTKLKARPGKPVVVHWMESTTYTGQAEEHEEHSVTCKQPGIPSLYEAMDMLRSHVCEVCEFGVLYGADMTIIGLTLVRRTEETCITVTALKKLKGCDAPLVINTPLAPAGNALRVVELIQDEAGRYVNGIRGQLEIDFSKQEDEEPEEVEA